MSELAIIVGAGPGLSASLARLCAQEGMRVVLAARNVAKLSALAEETGAAVHACDASRREDVDALFDTVLDAEGVPDLVVFNPSARVRGAVADIDPEAVERAIAITAYGGFLVGRRAAMAMRRARVGLDPVHRRLGQREGLSRVGLLRHGQVRTAGPRAEHGARTGAEGGPRRALRHRRWYRERCARPRSRRVARPGCDRADLPARPPPASQARGPGKSS